VVLALTIPAVALLTVHRNLQSARSTARATAREIDPSLARNYRILRRSLTPAGALPPGFAQHGAAGVARGLFPHGGEWLPGQPGPPSISSIGLLPALTQRTTIPGTGYSAWVIPGRHGMCWTSENGRLPPDPAICVGSLERRAAAIIDGPWVAVEIVGRIVGLVTDRVLSVKLVNAAGQGHRVPFHDGFYVSDFPTAAQRLVAVTRRGIEPLYPQRMPAPRSRIVGSATKTVARSARPEVVLTGKRGLHVRLMSEMSCMTPPVAAGRSSGSGQTAPVMGYQHQGAYQLPVVVPLGFPTGSSRLAACYVSAMVTAAAGTRGTAQVVIADR
jgi:hypothetical protein